MPAKNARLVNGLLNASFILQNLPEDLVLPPLPPITDPALECTALTHVSFHGLKRRDDDFDLEQAEKILDYEKLEFVGDGILGGLVTPLCHDLYPNLRQGASTLLKTGMVANTTLAMIADAYKLPQRLKTSPDAFYAAPSSVKVKASVFESWVAGVYYSQLAEIIKRCSNQEPPIEVTKGGSEQDSLEVYFKESPQNSPKVSHPDTPPVDETEADMDAVEDECGSGSDSDDPITYVSRLFRPMRGMSSSSRQSVSTTASQIPDVPTIPDAYHIAQGEAIAFLNAWIRPLFTPIAHYTMHCIQEYKVQLTKEQTKAPLEQGEQEGDDERAVGAKSALSTYTSKRFHSLPVYTYDRASGGFWRAKCAVVDDQGKSLEAIAVRANQRQASMVAAYRICRQLKFVK